MSRVISIDFESYYDDECSVVTLGAEQYTRHPKFDVYMVSVCDGEETWVGHPDDFQWESLAGATLLSHNAYFDQALYEYLVRTGKAPRIQFEAWHCTANLSAYISNRRSLADAVKFFYGVDLSKGMRNWMKGKTWAEAIALGKDKEMLEYARHDAHWCWKIWNDYSPQWPQNEQKLSKLTIDSGKYGVAINLPLLKEYIHATEREIINIEASLPWVAAGGKPTSPKSIAEQCRTVGIPCPPVKSHDGGEEAFVEWETKWGAQFDWVKNVGLWRSTNKVLAGLKTIEMRLREDGTIESPLKYFGAHCVSGDTELLTREGWVRIDQWKGGDIAQWNPTDIIEFLPATPNKFSCDGQTLKLDAPYAKGVFTLGHTIPRFLHGSGKFATSRAGDMPARASSSLPISGNLIGEGKITVAQMRILVAVQADGHWTPEKEGRVLQFTFRKSRKISRIKKLLAEVGVLYKVQEFPSCPGQFRVSVSRKDCPAWLCPERKFFGSWLLDSTSEARREFIKEIAYWDGHTAPTHIEYYSSDLNNIRWVSTMAHLTGSAVAVHPKTVSLRNTTTCLAFKEHWSPGPKCAEVFCPTTMTGFWLYRYADTIGVTGNTGRWSGESGFSFHNIRKEPLVCGGVPIDIRKLIIPRPGKKFIGCDLAQIEPRVLAWLTKNIKLLEMMRTGMNLYEAFARTQTENPWVGGDLKTEDKDRYQLSKIQVLGLGYGCGWEKFITVALDYGVVLTEETSKPIVTTFRAANPLITGLWKTLDNAFKRSVGDKQFTIDLPSGRVLTYRNVTNSVRIKTDDEGKVIRERCVVAEVTKGGKAIKAPLYGGLLTENVVQAIARDVFAEHLLELADAGLRVPFHVHDEAVSEVDKNIEVGYVEQIMARTPDWLEGCPIAAEGHEAEYYKK